MTRTTSCAWTSASNKTERIDEGAIVPRNPARDDGDDGAGAADAPSAAADEFFEKEVRPLLIDRCLKCHGGEKTRGGLKLTSRDAILQGGDTGPAAVPGKPNDSLLVQLLHRDDTTRMPKGDKLPDHDIAILTRWVEIGLPYPAAAALAGGFHITDEQRRFWAFQPVKVVPPPPVKDTNWARSDLDRYILAGLEAKGLKPAKAADKRTLIRRATFDLTGLPPTPEEIDAFLQDDAPDAYAKVVDRLLASPAYGERWGRHWLDLARYTDSFDARLAPGNEMDCGDAWRYRDWVIDAFNKDIPYDQFVRDQIAGDLTPGKDGGFNRDGIIATGFLALGNWGGGDADKDKLLTDIADDQVDATSRTFLGLTVACARCHDHKFDPISQSDYYGMAGIFFSTHILTNVGPKTNGPPMLRIPLASPAELAKQEKRRQRIAELEKQLKAMRDQAYQDFAKSQLSETAKYLEAAWEYRNRPADSPPPPLADFAAHKGLHAFALRQWIDSLGGGDYKLLTKAVRNVGGKAGVSARRGEADCPNVVANGTDQEVAIQTFKLPPKSLSVHPGPSNGVVVSWRSPVKGAVHISGGVTDADPVCGDGIAWAIDVRRASGRKELASGDFPNGGAQKFDQGKGAASLTFRGCGGGRRRRAGGPAKGRLQLRHDDGGLEHRACRRLEDLEPGRRRDGGPAARRQGQPARRPLREPRRVVVLGHGRQPKGTADRRPGHGGLGEGGGRRRSIGRRAGGARFPEGIHANRRRKSFLDPKRRG